MEVNRGHRVFAIQRLVRFIMTEPEHMEQIPQQPTGRISHIAELEDFTCPVCMNDISDVEKKTQTSCGHIFCMDCIKSLPCLAESPNCVSCPMCRTKLRKYTTAEAPLNKVPLAEIRRRLEQINRNVGYFQSRIERAPHDMENLIQRIQDMWQQEDNTRQYLREALETQRILQEQVNQRARPRQQRQQRHSVNPAPININV
jgi:hypothetical protein